MYEILLKGPKAIVSAVNQGTQTDGVYEINSMKKEGLKFLVSRVYNYETIRAIGNHKMCSIADDHFFLKHEDEKDEFEENPSAYNDADDDYEDELFSDNQVPCCMDDSVHWNHRCRFHYHLHSY